MIDIFSVAPDTWFTILYFMSVILFFPITLISKWSFARLTEQKFVWQTVYWIDLILFGLAVYTFKSHFEIAANVNTAFGLTPNPSSNLMYFAAYADNLSASEINVQFVTGFISAFLFLKLLLSLNVNKTLGPIISTIIFMFNDIAVFIVIWLIILVGFTIVSMIAFQDVLPF